MRDSERGVLRYVADYICRHLRKKLEKGSHEFKEEMVLYLMDLVKDSEDCEAKIETDEQWTHLIDRGGLWHVKESTYQLFHAVEHVVSEGMLNIKNLSLPLKQEMIKRVMEDDDMLFYCSLLLQILKLMMTKFTKIFCIK